MAVVVSLKCYVMTYFYLIYRIRNTVDTETG